MRSKVFSNFADDVLACESFAGKPFVYASNGTTSLHFDIGVVQSRMRDDSPNRLVLGYTRVMMGFLLINTAPKRIAMIGLGGGSIPKYCYHHLPGSQIDVVEINPDVIALRERFQIPADDDRLRVRCEDGLDFIRREKAAHDILIVDAFDVGGHAKPLCTQNFYDDCYASLGGDGVMVVNLSGNDRRRDSYLAWMRRSFDGEVAVMKCNDSTNRIAFAIKGHADWHSPQRLISVARQLEGLHPLKFQHLAQKLQRADCSTPSLSVPAPYGEGHVS